MLLREQVDGIVYHEIAAILSATHLKKIVVTNAGLSIATKSTITQIRRQNAIGAGTYVVTKPYKHALRLDQQRAPLKIRHKLLLPSGPDWETHTLRLDVHLQPLQDEIDRLSGFCPTRMQVLALFKLRRGHDVTIIYKPNNPYVILSSGNITIVLIPGGASPADTCDKRLTGVPVTLMDACKAEAAARDTSVNKLMIEWITEGLSTLEPLTEEDPISTNGASVKSRRVPALPNNVKTGQ